MAIWTDLVILLGGRALLTLLGIVLIVVGSWLADRAWDESSSSSSRNEDKDPETTTTAYDNLEEDISDLVKNPSYYWNNAVRNPIRGGFYRKLGLLGWLVLAVGCWLFDRRDWWSLMDWRTTATATWSDVLWNLLMTLLFLLLAVGHSVILPTLMSANQVDRYQHALAGSLLLTYMLTAGCMLLLNHHESPSTNSWLPLCSAAAVASSPCLLWLERKRGHHYNNDVSNRFLPASIFSLGGPLLVWGWCGLWVTLNTVQAYPSGGGTSGAFWYLPIPAHAGMAWAGAAAVLTVLWMAGYAHDHTSSSSPASLDHVVVAPPPGLAVAGRRVLGSRLVPLLWVAAWTLLGMAPLFPYVVGYVPWLLCGCAVAQGVVWAVIYYCGFVHWGDPTDDLVLLWSKCSRVAVALASVWLLTVLVLGPVAVFSSSSAGASVVAPTALVAVGGFVSLIVGLRCLHQDRRRGKVWMETGEELSEDEMVVYSYGGLLVPVGMCCVAYIMSLPVR